LLTDEDLKKNKNYSANIITNIIKDKGKVLMFVESNDYPMMIKEIYNNSKSEVSIKIIEEPYKATMLATAFRFHKYLH